MGGREPKYINNICVAFVALQYVHISDTNRSEKKDQVLIAYIYSVAKLCIEHLFILVFKTKF